MWGPEAIRDPFHEACNQSAKPDTRTSSRSADLAGTGPSVAAFWDHDVKNNNLRMKRHDEQVHHDNRPECRSFQHQTEPQANSQGAVAIQTRRKLDGYELAQAAAGRPRHGVRVTQGVRSSAALIKNLSALVGPGLYVNNSVSRTLPPIRNQREKRHKKFSTVGTTHQLLRFFHRCERPGRTHSSRQHLSLFPLEAKTSGSQPPPSASRSFFKPVQFFSCIVRPA